MAWHLRTVPIVVAVAVSLFAAEEALAQLKGTATYQERMALPPDAIFEVTLEDASKADAEAQVLGRVIIESPGNPPIAFEIPYDASKIDLRRRYTVRARILVGARLLFTTDQHYPVLTAGNGREVTLILRRVGGSVPTNSVGPRSNFWSLAPVE
jgi:putative lipoprotein